MFVAEYQVMTGDILTHPPGTEHTTIMREMKTLRGASKRIRKSIIPEGAVRCNIYSVTDIQNRATYELRSVLVLMNYGSGNQWV